MQAMESEQDQIIFNDQSDEEVQDPFNEVYVWGGRNTFLLMMMIMEFR